MNKHSYGVMQYVHDAEGIHQKPIRRVDASSYEDAVRQVAGDGLTLFNDARVSDKGVAYLAAKVWDGSGFRYCFRYPWTAADAA
jgi:hypothetical protein